MSRILSASIAALLSGVSTLALAQGQDTGGSQGEEASGVETVIVVAQRRAENLQNVPAAVTAIGAQQLINTGVTDTRALTQAVPSLVFSRSNSAMQPSIRGIGTRGNSAGDESSVSLYVDGVYQPELNSLAFELMKIERVEVLRGPQGTLYGRNATGGLINIITPDPSFEPHAEATLTYGRFNQRSFQTYLTGGFADKFAADLAVMGYKDDGYNKDLLRGGHTGAKDSIGARTKLLFKPVDRFKAVLTMNYSNGSDDSGVSNAVFDGNSKGRAVPGAIFSTQAWKSGTNDTPFIQTSQSGGSLATTTEFRWFNVETTSAFQQNRLHILNDSDGTSTNLGHSDVIERSKYYQQEVRFLSNNGGKLEWIAGAFFFGGAGQFSPFDVTNGTVPVVSVGSKQKVWSWAPFAEATYAITDALRFTAGVRYTYERRNYSAFNLLSPASPGIAAETHFEKLTPRFSLQYRFSDKANVYATYSRGFKSGVFNAFSATVTDAVRPEVLDAYEIGLKADPMPWLRTNVAAFHYEYKDIQLSARDASGLAPKLLNAAHARVNGVELELAAVVTPEFDVNLNATYLDAKYNEFPGAPLFIPIGPPGYGNITSGASAVADKSGFPMIRAPKFAANLALNWHRDFDIGRLQASANFYYSTKYFWAYQDNYVQPAYTRINAQVSWRSPDEHYTLSVWGRNLTNEEIIQQLIPGGTADLVNYERPISYGVSLKVSF